MYAAGLVQRDIKPANLWLRLPLQGGETFDRAMRTLPSLVLLPLPATRISTGLLHSCAATVDGRAYCGGRNVTGQLGDGTTDTGWSPVLVTGS